MDTGSPRFGDDVVHVRVPAGDNLQSVHVRNLLHTLIDEGRATGDASDTAIPTDVFIDLERLDLDLLDAPPHVQYLLNVGYDGDFSRPGFKYTLSFSDAIGKPVPGGKRTGAVVHFGSSLFLLHRTQFELMREVESFNQIAPDPKESRSDLLTRQLKPFARIQQLAEESQSSLASYLRSQHVVVPTSIEPQLVLETTGSARLEPIFGVTEPRGEEAGGGASFTRILTAAQSERIKGALDESGAPVGKRYVVERSPEARTHVILDSEVRDAVQEMAEIGTMSPEETADFLENPHSFLTSNAFHLDDFSERVVEVAELRFLSNPGVTPRRMRFDWERLIIQLESADGSPSDQEVVLDSADSLLRFERAYERAKDRGRDRFVFQGAVLRTDDPEIESIISGARATLVLEGTLPGDRERAAEKARELGLAEKRPSLGLKIKDNLEVLDQETLISTPLEQLGLRLPASLRPDVTLYPFQEQGIAWLGDLEHSGRPGGLLADDMGLGKTLQVLCFLVRLLEEGRKRPILVVAPVSLLEIWSGELARRFLAPYNAKSLIVHAGFVRQHQTKGATVRQRDGSEVHLPNKKVFSPRGMRLLSEADIIVTNYETVRDYQLSFGSIPLGVVVCDEAQKIKNPTTHVTNALKAMNAEFRIVSTATPVENSLVDLWSLVDFVAPGYLGSLREFREQHIPNAEEPPDPAAIASLRQRLDQDHLILRRTKKRELKGLPAKTEKRVELELSAKQVRAYSALAQAAAANPEQILGALISMIAACSHPALCFRGEITRAEPEDLIRDCPKLAWTMDTLDAVKLKGEKVLIFTRLRDMQRILSLCIAQRFGRDFTPEVINGSTPAALRQSLVDRFNEGPGFSVMILSPEAAGFGLNIVGANHVIHYTRLWNPAKEDQATDRVYRIGQERDVFVYYPITQFPGWQKGDEPTVEQQIDALLQAKRAVMQEFLVPSESLTISADELWRSVTGGAERVPVMAPIAETDLDALTEKQLLALAEVLFSKQGYDVERTPEVGNFGVDLVGLAENGARSALIRCSTAMDTEKLRSELEMLAAAQSFYEQRHGRRFDELVLITSEKLDGEFLETAGQTAGTVLDKDAILALAGQHGVQLQDLLGWARPAGR